MPRFEKQWEAISAFFSTTTFVMTVAATVITDVATVTQLRAENATAYAARDRGDTQFRTAQTHVCITLS